MDPIRLKTDHILQGASLMMMDLSGQAEPMDA